MRVLGIFNHHMAAFGIRKQNELQNYFAVFQYVGMVRFVRAGNVVIVHNPFKQRHCGLARLLAAGGFPILNGGHIAVPHAVEAGNNMIWTLGHGSV